jgi:hypothetical protein
MNRKSSELKGSIQVIQEITRTQAAKELQPAVSTRTLQKYLEVAALFLPSFADFQDPETGYLNRLAKLNTWHLPKLQRIREYGRLHGMTRLQVALSKHPEYFETGAINNVNNQTGSTNVQSILQKAS